MIGVVYVSVSACTLVLGAAYAGYTAYDAEDAAGTMLMVFMSALVWPLALPMFLGYLFNKNWR